MNFQSHNTQYTQYIQSTIQSRINILNQRIRNLQYTDTELCCDIINNLIHVSIDITHDHVLLNVFTPQIDDLYTFLDEKINFFIEHTHTPVEQ